MKGILCSIWGLAVLFFLPNYLLFYQPAMGKALSGTRCSAIPSFVANQEPQKTLHVPDDYPSIAQAVGHAREGDWVIISPGEYVENNIKITHPITVSSEWKLSGDLSKIDRTLVDAEDSRLFIITADGVEISGLHIINGNHTLDISSKVTVQYNHFVNNQDALSFEGSGGGYAGYNTIENDRDDGIDLDIRSDPNHKKNYILVEHNRIVNSRDDGIEVRLFSNPEQNIRYTFRKNTIIGSQNAGIQLISYDTYTGNEFSIHHNIISGCKTGLGCMEGSNSKEDLRGASKMDERVYFFNNTLVGNQMGATGGNHIVAINNLVQGNSLGGFKRFGRKSVIVNNLFFNNGGENFLDIHGSAVNRDNQVGVDPLLNKNNFMPEANSPVFDAGVSIYHLNDGAFPEIPAPYIVGSAPDIGAVELIPNE